LWGWRDQEIKGGKGGRFVVLKKGNNKKLTGIQLDWGGGRKGKGWKWGKDWFGMKGDRKRGRRGDWLGWREGGREERRKGARICNYERR
jgi:hypothetical protein